MPVYGLMIAFHAFVLLHLADGPLWKSIAFQESYNCQYNWWINILFVNNYVNANHPVCEILLCNLNDNKKMKKKKNLKKPLPVVIFIVNIFFLLVYYSIVVFGVRHAIFRRRHRTRLSRVEIPEVRSIPNVDYDFSVRFDSGSCRIRSSFLSNVYGFRFVSKTVRFRCGYT